MNKVGIPKGMRDFSPEVMAKRNYIFDTIRRSFQKFGYQQIETPTMENRETLLGKYGDEGDRLIFNVLNSGDYLQKSNELAFTEKNSQSFTSSISEKAMRYDLTVPFARYVVQHQNDITFPFKRFQIQPVWRADRPQKGRYREFYQCDADVIGSKSQLNELELIQIFDEVLSNLGLEDFTIKINNRKILSGIAELIGKPDKIFDITVAIDKLEKIGKEKVFEELSSKGLNNEELNKLDPLFELKGDNRQVTRQLSSLLNETPSGVEGLKELEELLDYLENIDIQQAVIELDVTLARGLNYYTGAIFEVVSNEVQIGSICGGGRYADLTGIFGLKDMSGVGISFGADRIYDVLDKLDRFPEQIAQTPEVLILNFGNKEELFALKLLQKMRNEGIEVELYPDRVKMPKQMKYANQRNIKYVILAGSQEIESNALTLKDMKSGEQYKLTTEELIIKFKS